MHVGQNNHAQLLAEVQHAAVMREIKGGAVREHLHHVDEPADKQVRAAGRAGARQVHAPVMCGRRLQTRVVPTGTTPTGVSSPAQWRLERGVNGTSSAPNKRSAHKHRGYVAA